MSDKNLKLSELTEEEYQETLSEISKRLGLKMLPDDHPIYKESPAIILNPFSKNDFEEDKDRNSK